MSSFRERHRTATHSPQRAPHPKTFSSVHGFVQYSSVQGTATFASASGTTISSNLEIYRRYTTLECCARSNSCPNKGQSLKREAQHLWPMDAASHPEITRGSRERHHGKNVKGPQPERRKSRSEVPRKGPRCCTSKCHYGGGALKSCRDQFWRSWLAPTESFEKRTILLSRSTRNSPIRLCSLHCTLSSHHVLPVTNATKRLGRARKNSRRWRITAT